MKKRRKIAAICMVVLLLGINLGIKQNVSAAVINWSIQEMSEIHDEIMSEMEDMRREREKWENMKAAETDSNVLLGNIYALDFEAYISGGGYNCEECTFLGIEEIKRKDIKKVIFVDSLSGHGKEVWDVSEKQDLSVLLWREADGDLYDIYIWANGAVKLKSPGCLFYYCVQLEEIEFNHLVDTSEATFMGSMFASCRSLKQIDLSDFNTSNVTSMNNMFAGSSSLESLDLSYFDTSSVTDMSSLFSVCASLGSVDVSGFDTSNVVNMGYMFSGCSSLKQLSLSNFDTSKVENMNKMFINCEKLSDLDISSFELDSLESMEEAFSGTIYSEIETISDLKDFILNVDNTAEVTEDATVQYGSVVNVSYVASFVEDSSQFYERKVDYEVVIGNSDIVNINGFDECLLGLKKGESHSIAFTFPADYPDQEAAGKEVIYTIYINSIIA